MAGLMERYKKEVAERDRSRQEMKELAEAAKVEGRGNAKQDGVEPSSGDSNDGGKTEVKVDVKTEGKKSLAPRKKFVWNTSCRSEIFYFFFLHFHFSRMTH